MPFPALLAVPVATKLVAAAAATTVGGAAAWGVKKRREKQAAERRRESRARAERAKRNAAIDELAEELELILTRYGIDPESLDVTTRTLISRWARDLDSIPGALDMDAESLEKSLQWLKEARSWQAKERKLKALKAKIRRL